MDAIEIFKLFGSILVDNTKANESISKTEQKAGGLAEKLGAGIKTAGKWGLAIGAGAAAAGGAMLGVANKAAQTTDRIDKLSQKIGMSRQAFQEWDFITSQSGMSVEQLQMGFKTLVTQVDQAVKGTGKGAESFRKLGVSVTDANGAVKSQEAIFEEAVIALQHMEDGTEKAKLANDLFGRSGAELMPLLNGAAGSVEEMKEKAHELGLVLGDEAIDAGVKFTDTMDQLKRSGGAVFTQIGTALMPMFINLAEWIMEHMPQIREVASKAFEIIRTAVGKVKDIFDALQPVLSVLWEFVKWAFPKISAAIELAFGIVTEVVGGVAEAFGWVVDKVKAAYEWLTKWNDKDAKKKTVEVEERTTPGRGGRGSAPHASGLAYVPYDGFVAELHKGERVLSRGEVAAAGMGNITLNITGNHIASDYDVNRIGDIVVDKLRRELRR